MSSAQQGGPAAIQDVVREKYGEAARRVRTGEGLPADCCGQTGCCGGAAAASCDPITSNLYVSGETDTLPEAAVLASLGCGNPTALDEMLALAEENRSKAGATNVEFLKGTIEAIPLPDASVDVIISNCVINLSGDKGRVLREAFRVLKPGGRFAVSDVVVQGTLPPDVKRSMELWVGCVAGALEEGEF